MDDTELIEILAAITARLQDTNTRTLQTEEIFGNSAIIPSNKINAILTAFVCVIFILCSTFAFLWYLDRPV